VTRTQRPAHPLTILQRKLVSTAALIAIAFIAACSDSTTQPGGDLSTEQIQSMTSALSFLLGVSLGHPEASLTSPAQFDAPRVAGVALPVSGSTSCPEEGRVGFNGTFSTDSAGDGIFALTDTLVDCGIKDNHSIIWTFTSKPTVAVTIEDLTNIHGDSIDLAHSTLIQTDVGTVQYSTGSMSGTCPLDISIRYDVSRGTPTADSATFSLSAVATVCGHTVTRDTSSTISYTPPS
jgi:hypothetical protein